MNRQPRGRWSDGLVFVFVFVACTICDSAYAGDWVQVMDVCKTQAGDKLIGEYFFLSGPFSASTIQSNKLYVQWANGEKELLTVRHYMSRRGPCSCSTNGDLYVIACAADLFYRKKSSTPGQWNVWTLTATQNIYDFIKGYLDDHYTNSYAPLNRDYWPPGTFEIKRNNPDEEQTLPIATRGDLPYNIKEILNGGHDLVAVPDLDNPYAPTLIFSQNKEVPGWHLNKRETLRRNENRK